MDFPFEYVERVFNRPSFDHHQVSKKVQDKNCQQHVQLTRKEAGSEEDELAGLVPEVVKEKEKKMLREIQKFEIMLKGKKEPISSGCSSSDSNDYESLGDTSDTDAVKGFYTSAKEKDDMVFKKYKIMHECCCTGSECKSNSELTISSSSSSTYTSEEEIEKIKGTDETKTEITETYGSSSDETTSSSEDEMDVDDEIEFLENLLDEMKKEEDKKNGKVVNSEGSDDELDSMFDESKSKSPKSSEKSNKKSKEKSSEKSNLEPTSFPILFSSGSSTTSISSVQSGSESFLLSSSDPEMENSKSNLEKFKWQSDDLYESTDTDSEIEKALGYLGRAMAEADGPFSNANVIGAEAPLQKEKFKTFQQSPPVYLKTKRSYEMMEEPETEKTNTDVLTKQLWLVQQLDTGLMCSAKLVSRRNPEHLQLQKNLDKERKLLYELLPEISKPSHIARLLDVGIDENFKFLIFEDLGMDLLTLFEEFGAVLKPSVIFLITYFTFNSIKELHSFDILHLDIRPSTFSVTYHPFNIKIIDYSRCTKKRSRMKTPEDIRPDSFSPRVFHQKEGEFDKFVDFESWIYTMIHLCTNFRLPWYGDQKEMLEKKESFFNDPTDMIYNGCIEAVPMAASFIADFKITYEEFLQKMNLIFSIDVMRFSDKDQPRLWSVRELEEMKKERNEMESDEENKEELMESHWNPVDESDTDDAKSDDGKEEKTKDGGAKKGKNDKKRQPSREEMSLPSPTQSSALSEPSSNNEQWSEASSGLEKSKPEKVVIRKNPTPPPRTKVADHMLLVEPLSGQEQFSMPTSFNEKKKKKDEAAAPMKVEKKKSERPRSTSPVAGKAPPGPKGKKNKRPLIDRQFILEMKKDLKLNAISSTSSDSSYTSFSTWTSSTCSTDEDKRFKWSLKSEDGSVIEFFEDMNKYERDCHKKYEHLRAMCIRDDLASSSGSEIDPFSDIDSDDNKAILRRIERRSEEVGWELYSDKEKSGGELEPEDYLKEQEKKGVEKTHQK